MKAYQFLKPTLAFYRLNLAIGAIGSPIVLFLADYLDENLPSVLHYLIVFSILCIVLYFLTYTSGFFARNLRKIFIITGILASTLFQYISYAYNFIYIALVAQILIIISITFVLINLRELTVFLVIYWIFDIFLIFAFGNRILYVKEYRFEFFHQHLMILSSIAVCYVAMISRSSQAEKFEELIYARDLAVDFISESRRELEDMRFALNAASIVAITDRQGVITYVNQNFEKISGYSAEELLGNTHRIVNSGYHPPEFFREMWKTISSGQVWKGEIRNKRKDGSFYWVATTIVPLSNNHSYPNRYLAIRNDITPRKIAEEKLRESEERFRNLYKTLKEDLQLAGETQKYLMPRPESFPGFQWKSFVRPYRDVSGDLIAMKSSANKVDILLADIAGHGVGAALISALVVYAFQLMEDPDAAVNGRFSPSRALLHLRDRIQALQVDEFVCGTYLKLDLNEKQLHYSYAGQLPGLLHREGVTTCLEGKGMPLLPKGKLFQEDHSISVQSGDQFLFFSDGVYEITNLNEEILGYEIFKELAHLTFLSAGDVFEKIKEEIFSYCMNAPKDDISILYLKID